MNGGACQTAQLKIDCDCSGPNWKLMTAARAVTKILGNLYNRSAINKFSFCEEPLCSSNKQRKLRASGYPKKPASYRGFTVPILLAQPTGSLTTNLYHRCRMWT